MLNIIYITETDQNKEQEKIFQENRHKLPRNNSRKFSFSMYQEHLIIYVYTSSIHSGQSI